MGAVVVKLMATQAQPWIDAARRMQPIIRDRDIDRMMADKWTLSDIKAELFRMVTLDPAWVAEALSDDIQHTDRAPIDQAQSIAGAATFDGVTTAAQSASRRPWLLRVAVALITFIIDRCRGPLGRLSIKGNSAPRLVSRCRVPKPGNSPEGNSCQGNSP